jgi:hypothetical protein
MELSESLRQMDAAYRADPVAAVRNASFIKLLHAYVADAVAARLTPAAKRAGIRVVAEATILGSHKPKDVDLAVVDPLNGPLILIGLRSQMSSVGKNVLTYYEGIIGECISLQDRYPLAVHAYTYLMPLTAIKVGLEKEQIDHARYAKLYAAITGRAGPMYSMTRGVYDQFAYMVVDFGTSPPTLRDDLVQAAVPDVDLRVGTFVDRVISTFVNRHLFLDKIFV